MKTQNFIHKTMAWIILCIITTIVFSCEKDPLEDCRKDPTCEYFTCKVNGERWEPNCDGGPLFGCTPWDVLYGGGIKAMDMHIDNEAKNSRITMIVRKEWLKIGNNQLYTDDFIQTFYADGGEICNIFVLDTISPHSFNILQIDTIKYYLKGTFNFNGKNDCGDQVTITEGEFNLPYRF